MAENKTKPTSASIDEYLASRASPEQLKDCKAIMAMCRRVTKQRPKMWGPSIVGYGSYSYRYESGHSGQSCLAAFAIRGRDLVVYLAPGAPGQDKLLAKLGKHKMGKSCLYFRRLADLDAKVLEALIAQSAAEAKRRWPDSGADDLERVSGGVGKAAVVAGERGKALAKRRGSIGRNDPLEVEQS
ncbi:MAG TPA: DUF1801 domain-containing protein [Candidatus Polarisedimenticolaceae bacterium]